MKLFALKVGWLTLLLIAFAAAVAAQNSGSIQGVVVDPAGGVVPDATVTAFDEAKGVVVRVTTSAPDGSFVLQPLDPGTYTVRVQAKGMKDLESKGVVLDSRQVLSLGELRLSLGATTERVTVEAAVPLVETATADHSAVIDSRQVEEISMNGRDFQSLVRTLPGVVSNDSSDFRLAFNNTDSFHVNGNRGSNNNVYLDGAINTDVGANDGQFTQLSMDAVGEFKLQTNNFAAEYGRNPGVLLAINTKSGGQQFHGTAYEFNRENGFDSNQFFNKVGTNGVAKIPVPNAQLRFNQYGFNIGGPIPLPKVSPWNSKKMFFFFNFEGTKALRPNGGNTYQMPDPKWLGIGTPNGDADFSSGLKSATIATVTAATCPTNPSIPQGTVFQPGSVKYDSANNIICGNPYPGNIVPKSQFSQQYAGFINLIKPFYRAGAIPEANPSILDEPFQDTYHFNKHQEVVRYDWNINAKTNFFFRWVDDSQREAQQFGIFSGNSFPALPQFRKKPGSSWSWNLVNVISPTITNEFVFGYNHLTQVVDVDTTPQNYDKTLLGFTYQDIFSGANIRNERPSFNANTGGGPSLNSSPFPSGWTSEARAFTWTDNLTKISGPHTVKFGGFFDYNQAGQQPAWQENVFLDFRAGGPNFVNDTTNGVANLLLGNYQNVNQTNGVFFGAFRFHQFEIYGQDTWKMNRKLTLDYGLRWAYIGPTYTVKPFLENYFDSSKYDPAQAVTIDTRATNLTGGNHIINGSTCSLTNPCPGVTNFGNPFNGLVQENKGIPPGFVDHKYGNVEPRIGFAYDPWGNGKTAIRGGFGIFHERIRQNVNSFDALGNPPLVFSPTIPNGTIDQLGPGLVASGVRTPVSLRTPAKDGKIPTTYSWSIGVQRELPWKLGLDVAYVGEQSRHLQYIYDLNQFPVGSTTGGLTAPPNSTWLAVARFVGYSQVNYTDYGANAEYNALQVAITRRFSRSLTLRADYTYSKNRDLSDSDDTFTSVRDRFNPKLDYGPTGWDRPHVFNFNYVYDFPEFRGRGAFLRLALGGWESSGVVRAWSGTPFSMLCGGSSGTNSSGAGSAAAPLCDYIGGPIYAAGHKSLDPQDANGDISAIQWINPLAFARPQQGTLGNTTRNEFRGPGYQNWNLSIFKNFTFSESRRLQLRLETFNTFNHLQFGGSNGGVNRSILLQNPGQSPTPNAIVGGKFVSGTVGNFGKLNSARDPRQIQLGAKFYF